MTFRDDIGNILSQYSGDPPQDSPRIEADFSEVARHADPADLREGINEAFRSDQTPAFGDMVGQLFGQADNQQRSGMLGQLISGLGPAVLGSLAAGRSGGGLGGLLGGGNGGGLGGMLGNILNGLGGNGGTPQISPADVQNLPPDQVRDLANRAEKENPGIIEHMSKFYAEHPTLVKTLGAAALAIAMNKMSQRRA